MFYPTSKSDQMTSFNFPKINKPKNQPGNKMLWYVNDYGYHKKNNNNGLQHFASFLNCFPPYFNVFFVCFLFIGFEKF